MCSTLIVEDNAMFRRSLKEMLGFRFPSMSIDEAADGGEAMRKIQTLLPDLVFMDIKLPGVNGLELTKQIKARHSSIIIIILTSNDLPEYREAAYRSGASHFLAKGNSTSEEISHLVETIVSGDACGIH